MSLISTPGGVLQAPAGLLRSPAASYGSSVLPDAAWDASKSYSPGPYYVNVPGFGSLLPSGSVTVEFWAYCRGGNESIVFGAASASQRAQRTAAHLPWENGALYWDHGNLDGTGRLTAPLEGVLYNSWQHIAFVADKVNSSMSVQLNGEEILREDIYSDYEPLQEDFHLGYWDVLSRFWNGVMGEFRVWDYARTPTQTLADYQTTFNSGKPGLLLSLRLDEVASAGNTIADRSGNGHTSVFVTG